MTLSSKGNRDRSYSDGHALLENSSQNVVISAATNVQTATNNTFNNDKPGTTAPTVNKTTCFKKQHHAQNYHHHGNQRPRSKSLDLHRHHSTPVHKKKFYPHSHKHIPARTHSPQYASGASSGHYQYQYPGRLSPVSSYSTSPQRYHGKMWIRPAAVRNPAPFLPAIGDVEESPPSLSVNKEHVPLTSFSPLLEDTPVRQETNCSSPIIGHATSFDDDIMQYASPDKNSSSFSDDPLYHQYQRQVCAPQPPRLIFGESGKPIVRGKAFERYASASTAAVL